MQTIAWGSKELVNQYNHFSSGNWFNADTMRFFKSRVTDNYRRLSDTEALFITTEKGPSEVRKATIRRAKLISYTRETDGYQTYKVTIETVGEFNQMSLAQAIRAMQKA